MTAEIARMVVRFSRTPSMLPNSEELMPRGSEISKLLSKSLSNNRIAEKPKIASGTVGRHLEEIFKKLHVRCRVEPAGKFLRPFHGSGFLPAVTFYGPESVRGYDTCHIS